MTHSTFGDLLGPILGMYHRFVESLIEQIWGFAQVFEQNINFRIDYFVLIEFGFIDGVDW